MTTTTTIICNGSLSLQGLFIVRGEQLRKKKHRERADEKACIKKQTTNRTEVGVAVVYDFILVLEMGMV